MDVLYNIYKLLFLPHTQYSFLFSPFETSSKNKIVTEHMLQREEYLGCVVIDNTLDLGLEHWRPPWGR